MTEKTQPGQNEDALEAEGIADDGPAEGGADAEVGVAQEEGSDAPDLSEAEDGVDASPEPPSPEEEAERLREQLAELNDRHLRLAAEFQNFKRRAESQRLDAWLHAQAELVKEFLDVLDDLRRVSGLDPEDEAVSVESIVEGVDLVERKFLRALSDAGVDILEPEGERFDPETMEAMMRVSTDDPEEDDCVADVLQMGYRMKNVLIRPARVSVLKHD